MLDTQTNSLQLVSEVVKLRLAEVVAKNCSFYELRPAIQALRQEFPNVTLSGPWLYAKQEECGVELVQAGEMLEVRVPATARMLADHEIGW